MVKYDITNDFIAFMYSYGIMNYRNILLFLNS